MPNSTVTSIDRRKIKVVGYRNDVGRLDRLIDSIKKEGLHRPIVLSPADVLLLGERRFAAYDKMAKPQVPVVYVSDIQELCKYLAGDTADKTASISLRPSELAAQLDAIIASGLSAPTSTSGHVFSIPKLLSEAIGVFETQVTSLLLMHRTANYGILERDRAWGREALERIDAGSGIASTRTWLIKLLLADYGRVDYNYIATRTKTVGSRHPTAISSAVDQRHALTQAAEMLESIASTLRTLGPLNDDLTTEERSAIAHRLRVARVPVSSTITLLEGRTR